MKIAVIGAGIVGICTAYELALDGHAVTVFERNGSVAEEASFACGGMLAPSLSHPLAWPSWPQSSGFRTLMQSSGVRLGRGSSLADLRWLMRWKRPGAGFLERFGAAHRLAQYSQMRRQELMLQSGLVCEQSSGLLQLLGSAREAQSWQERISSLRTLGVPVQLLDAEQARLYEPALASSLAFHGALHFAQDEAANCRQFAHALRERALQLGVSFHFSTTVKSLGQGSTIELHTDTQGTLGFERLVLCAGLGAAPLLGAVGRAALLRPVWSYSLSAQMREPLNAPRSAVLLPQGTAAISRMGQRIRASGGAQLGQPSPSAKKVAQDRLYRAVLSHFPGAADFSRSIQFWQGASVFSADALPLLGPSARNGVWLNLAHGHNGWSMACGAARLLADQMAGRNSDLDIGALAPARFKT